MVALDEHVFAGTLQSNPEIRPMLALVRLDCTSAWDEAWRFDNQVERMWSYYVCDLTTHVYLCEITPSLELHWLEDDFEITGFEHWAESERERMCEEVRSAGIETPAVHYAHVSDLKPENTIVLGCPDEADIIQWARDQIEGEHPATLFAYPKRPANATEEELRRL